MADFYHDKWSFASSIEGASQRVQEDTLKFARIMVGLGAELLRSGPLRPFLYQGEGTLLTRFFLLIMFKYDKESHPLCVNLKGISFYY